MLRPSFDREAIETEIDRVRSLGLDELRTLWRVTFRSPPPPAFTKDLMTRFIAALLTGRLFDDRGNRMSPTHANKKGARYRYYVSQALLQNRKAEAGSIARVPAPETENLVCDGVRRPPCSHGERAADRPLS